MSEFDGFMNDQKREFMRLDDMLPLSWRRCSEEELFTILEYFERHRAFPPRPASLDSMLSSLDISSKLQQLERNDPLMAKILGIIDIKLNLILRVFTPDRQERPLTPTPVNLSGGGMAFLERNPPLAAGDLLEIHLALTPDGLAMIQCYTRVLRIFEDFQDGLHKVACRFEPILDKDREAIVQFIFRRQAEYIRSRRQLGG